MDFKVRGHSSYSLSLRDGVVWKEATENDNRLVKSAQKQKDFNSQFFKTPKIFDINPSYFSMKYIKGYSFVEFLIYSTKNDLDKLLKKIEGYFKERIEGKETISANILEDKIKSIDPKYLELFGELNDIEVYKGKSHGDMTLSNMIFSNDIYLIDFLDSYIESPTMDLVKLRQDTHLFWSLEMSELTYDKNKVRIGLNYIDDWLVNNYDFTNYNLLQKLNLLRILPYAKTDRVKEFVNNSIPKLI